MTPDEHLAHLRADGAALVQAVRKSGIEAAVPVCPGWTAESLAGHVGMVHQWVAETIDRRAAEPGSRRDLPQPPAGGAVVPWLGQQTGRLGAALAQTPPATPGGDLRCPPPAGV